MHVGGSIAMQMDCGQERLQAVHCNNLNNPFIHPQVNVHTIRSIDVRYRKSFGDLCEPFAKQLAGTLEIALSATSRSPIE
jgi:hypothetical protein